MMFISLKWKAVVFSSVILTLISAAWMGQSVYNTVLNYKTELQQAHQSHQQILNQMVADDFLKFSQFSKLISEKPEIRQFYSAAQDFSMPEFLGGQWASLKASVDLDYVAILSAEGVMLGEAYNKNIAPDLASLHEAFSQYESLEARQAPHAFIYCQALCMQFSWEPFVFSNGAHGVIALGRNMADLAVRYNAALSSDIAILIQTNNLPAEDNRALPAWGHIIWASSRFPDELLVLNNYSLEHSLSSLGDLELFEFSGERYLFSPLHLQVSNQFGHSALFVDIVNETENRKDFMGAIWVSIWAGLLGLALSELALVFLILGPIKRLANVAEALNLLPKHRYKEAARVVGRNKAYVRDELTQLEDNTIFVSNQLEVLYGKIQDTHNDLSKKVHSLSKSRAFLTRLLDNPSVFVLTQTKDFDVILSNLKFKNTIKDAGNSFLDLFSNKRTKDEFIKEAKALTLNTGKAYQHEVIMRTYNERTLLVSWSHTLVEDEHGGEILVSVGMDNTEHKKDEVKLKWLANNDSLTKIGNRRSFMRDLQDLLENYSQGAVLIIDVNRFKQINDIYGHMAGDDVLIDIAQVLKKYALPVGSISRLSGDEFTVVLPEISVGDLGEFLTTLSMGLQGSVVLKTQRVVEYSVSIGAALFPDDGDSYQTLLAHADMAMYKAKKTGQSQWHIFNESDDNSEELKRDYYLSELIKSALANNLFQLVFQPILSINEGRVQHYETLLRLNDELGNQVSPAEFIPVSENLGLIRDIDNWVLEHALARLSEELEFQPELIFSINVSAPSLQMNEYAMVFVDAIKKYNVGAKHIIIELTETAHIENFKQVLENLTILTNEGVTIALDDFGVGFSSFSYLKQLPLRYVKLDGSYIRDLKDHPDNQAFVKSISEMVTAFGMRTIAEFVEDEATLDMLKTLGVYYAQGYYIGRPDSELLSNDFHL